MNENETHNVKSHAPYGPVGGETNAKTWNFGTATHGSGPQSTAQVRTAKYWSGPLSTAKHCSGPLRTAQNQLETTSDPPQGLQTVKQRSAGHTTCAYMR